MEFTLEVPGPVALALGCAHDTLPPRGWAALLVAERARGRHSRGKVAELLGLGFHDTEELLRGHRASYPIKTAAADTFDNASLPNADDRGRGQEQRHDLHQNQAPDDGTEP